MSGWDGMDGRGGMDGMNGIGGREWTADGGDECVEQRFVYYA